MSKEKAAGLVAARVQTGFFGRWALLPVLLPAARGRAGVLAAGPREMGCQGACPGGGGQATGEAVRSQGS